MITLETATKIAQTAFSEGAKEGVINMSVVVTDAGGHIRLAMRADGQGIFGIDTAKGKAMAALGFNRSSLLLSKIFDAAAIAAISGATGGNFVPLGGGVVIRNAENVIVGAAAVSGGLPEVDEKIIVAAVQAAGLSAV